MHLQSMLRKMQIIQISAVKDNRGLSSSSPRKLETSTANLKGQQELAGLRAGQGGKYSTTACGGEAGALVDPQGAVRLAGVRQAERAWLSSRIKIQAVSWQSV